MRSISERLKEAYDALASSNVVHQTPNNSRGYVCSVDGCGRNAYANGYCNAHYLRARKGLDLTLPIRRRVVDGVCKECSSPIDGKGGWGYCQKHYRNIKRKLTKEILVEYFGGVCKHCLGTFHPAVYDFHHIDGEGKDSALSDLFDSSNINAIESEALKCILLCANCHRIEHIK